MAILWLALFILRGRMGECRLCLLEGGRRGILILVPGAVVGRMGLEVGMVVGMVVALEVHVAVEVEGTAVVVDLWVLLLRPETGGVASDPMHTAEAEAAVVASGAEETATSGLYLSLCRA